MRPGIVRDGTSQSAGHFAAGTNVSLDSCKATNSPAPGLAEEEELRHHLAMVRKIGALWIALSIHWLGPPSANADMVSGPNRRTVLPAVCGSIYYNESGTGNWTITNQVGQINLKNGDKTFRVISTPQGVVVEAKSWKVVVNTTLQGFEVLLPDRKKFALDKEFSISSFVTPADKFEITELPSSVTITGGQGSTVIEQQINGFTVRSPAGLTRFVRTAAGEHMSGVALDRHLYLGRGFFVERDGVGVFIDMWKFLPKLAVSPSLEWNSFKTR